MPRNASGVYTLPAGNPVVPGTVIDAAWANDTLEDLANEVTNSLSRTGAGGMLAPFRIADGNVTAPGISYLNETNTGLYRSGAGSTWMSVLGVNTAQFSTVGLTIPSGKALTAQGNASVTGTFAVGGATTLASTLAVTGALTATGGVLGNITAGSGTSTFNNVTINGNLDMDAGSSGTITNLPNPTNPGDAANKAYVDAQDALRLALTGGTMTGVIAMSNNKVTGVATPTADQDAANKAYVDNIAQGIDAKASCKAATTANITLSGTQTIDGVAIVAGERVLVKNQSSAAENGIYVAAVSTWSRAADANTWDELVAAYTFIESGTDNGSNGYICTIAPGGTLGVTAVTWAQFSGAGQINAGTGMSKTGNTLNVNTASSSRIVVGADEIDLATTGVTASTYKSVTVDQWGRVTGGTNPTTLAGFGIGDAYTQAQTDSLLAAKLSTSGGTMSGVIAMGANKITGLADPTNAQDAATKTYIDTIFGSTTTAAASAAAAAASASAASTSASNASSSASSASASAASAAASFDSFDDRYLGAKASDPTVDNDGNPLLTGALYWNSTSNLMKVYDGAAWITSYLPASGYAQLAAANVFTENQTITANTSSDALKITQTGSGNALYIEDVASDATPFVVSSTGVMGIGTTTPDNVTSAGIALVSNSGYYPQLVQRNTTADGNASYVVLEKNRNGAIVQNGDVMGNLIFRGYDGASYLQGAFINAVVSATPGTNDMPTDLVFGTTPDGSAGPSERFRIKNNGAIAVAGSYGTSGQVLTSGGSGAVPTWTTPTTGTKTWTAITSTGSYTVPTGVTSIRVYAFGAGGNGAAPGAGGGGGGCAFGDLAVSAGQVYTVTISAGVATVTRSGTTYFTANPGTNASGSTEGSGGSASKDASVTNGGAYTGGAGGTSNSGGGGSSASPLGNGYAGGVGGGGGGGGGWGGVGGTSVSGYGGGGGAGGAGSQGGGGAGGAAYTGGGNDVTSRTGGVGRTIFNAFSDPLLANLNAPGTAYGSGSSGVTTLTAGPGGGGGKATGSTASYAGSGGMGGGGGSAYTSTASDAFGGGSLFGGGGGGGHSAGSGGTAKGGSPVYAGGGGGAQSTGGSPTAGTGGAAIVLIYA